jgi:hypothetical protein
MEVDLYPWMSLHSPLPLKNLGSGAGIKYPVILGDFAGVGERRGHVCSVVQVLNLSEVHSQYYCENSVAYAACRPRVPLFGP